MNMSMLADIIRKLILAKTFFVLCLVLLYPGQVNATQKSPAEILACLESSKELCTDYSSVRAAYGKFRILVGLLDYQRLNEVLKNSNRGYAPYAGIQYYYEGRSTAGRWEVKQIRRRYQKDLRDKRYAELRYIYEEEIKDLEKKYPFLTKLSSGVIHHGVAELIHDLKIYVGPGGKDATEKFFDALQADVVTEYTKKLNDIKAVTNCLKLSNCEISSELKQIYQEYRIYVGLLNYQDLAMRIKEVGRAFIPSHGELIEFTSRNEKGRKEFEYIKAKHEEDINMIHEKLGFEQAQTRSQNAALQQLRQGRRTFYREMILRYVIQYPLVIHAKTHNPDNEKLSMASQEVERSYEKLVKNVQDLKGDDRQELIGFPDILEKTAEKFSDEDNILVSSYIYRLQNDATIINRIKSIFTNARTAALAMCHIITYYANVPHPAVQVGRLVLGMACSAYGIFLTTVHMGHATYDLIRQLNYRITGKYSEEVLNQYMRSYVSTLIMAVLYVGPSLPGLWNRATGINKFGRISLRSHRRGTLWKNGLGKAFQARKAMAENVTGLARSYGEYYGEEILVNQLFTGGGKFLASMAIIEGAMAEVMRRSFKKRLQIYSYSVMLAATP